MGSRTARISAQLAHIYGLEQQQAECRCNGSSTEDPASHRAWFARELTGRLHECVPFELDFPIELEDGRQLWLPRAAKRTAVKRLEIERVFGVTFDITEKDDAQTERNAASCAIARSSKRVRNWTWIADAAGRKSISSATGTRSLLQEGLAQAANGSRSRSSRRP